VTPQTRFCGTCGHAIAATENAGPPSLAPTDDLAGREIAGRYRIVRQLGAGGMGAVYVAEQISLKRTVALKLLKSELSSNPGLIRRFNIEAELAAKLSHPNTVTMFDFGQDADGTLFIVMEFVAGRSLRDLIQREAPLPLARVIHIAEQVAASLSDAHARGIVHRDIKPDNVMLSEVGKRTDVVRVLDFGIAKLRDEREDGAVPVTQAGDMLGTPQYMAPEQIRSETVDGRTDVYSLGAVLYEMITGRLPFEGPTVMSILGKHLTENPAAPSQRRPDLPIPPLLDQLVVDCLRKDPSARPASMDAFVERLAASRGQLGAAPRRNTTRPPGVPLTVDELPPAATAPPVGSHAGPAGYALPMNTPPGYLPTPAPPGYAPTHGGYPPGYAPPTSPGPAAAASSSHLGLWLALGIGGAVVVALVIAFATRTKEDPPKASVDLGTIEDQMKDLEEKLGDIEIPDFNPPADVGKTNVGGSETAWKHPFLGYGLTVPTGMVAQDTARPALGVFVGAIDGIPTTITVSGEVIDGNPTDEMLANAARTLAVNAGGTIVESSWKTIQGRRRASVIYDVPAQGYRFEMVLFALPTLVVGAELAAPVAQFDRTAAARATLFEQRVRLPSP
jgi:serine/threonine-protein kinase